MIALYKRIIKKVNGRGKLILSGRCPEKVLVSNHYVDFFVVDLIDISFSWFSVDFMDKRQVVASFKPHIKKSSCKNVRKTLSAVE